jgi:hypothetical protein
VVDVSESSELAKLRAELGVPGMGGEKTEPLVVLTVQDGKPQTFSSSRWSPDNRLEISLLSVCRPAHLCLLCLNVGRPRALDVSDHIPDVLIRQAIAEADHIRLVVGDDRGNPELHNLEQLLVGMMPGMARGIVRGAGSFPSGRRSFQSGCPCNASP